MKIEFLPLYRKLPAGKYWVGDACYVFPDKDWQHYVSECYKGTDGVGLTNNGALVRLDDKFYGFDTHTAHGDGHYALKFHGKKLASLPVDAGNISIFHLDLVKSWEHKDWNFDLGFVVEIKQDFYVYSHGGDIKFASYSVKTS